VYKRGGLKVCGEMDDFGKKKMTPKERFIREN
jgi:hypothetical protein